MEKAEKLPNFKARGKWVEFRKPVEIDSYSIETYLALGKLMLFSYRTNPADIVNNRTTMFGDFAATVAWKSSFGVMFEASCCKRNNRLPNTTYYENAFSNPIPDRYGVVAEKMQPPSEGNSYPVLGKTYGDRYCSLFSSRPCIQDTIATLLGDAMAGRIQKYLREHGVMKRLTPGEEEPLVLPTLLPRRLYFSAESIGVMANVLDEDALHGMELIPDNRSLEQKIDDYMGYVKGVIKKHGRVGARKELDWPEGIDPLGSVWEKPLAAIPAWLKCKINAYQL